MADDTIGKIETACQQGRCDLSKTQEGVPARAVDRFGRRSDAEGSVTMDVYTCATCGASWDAVRRQSGDQIVRSEA